MAKFTSSLVSAASGKLGGTVFSHGRNGQIMRRHAVPTQPRTSAQRAVRNELSALSSAFRNLGAATIAGWNTLASGVTRKSKLGTTYHPTGQQLYVSCGKNLFSIGIAIGNMSAPTIPTIPALGSFSITAPTPNTQVSTLPLVVTGGLNSSYGVILSASGVQSSGRTFVGKSQFRLLKGLANASSLTMDLFTYYTTRYGALPQAGTIQASLKYIDPASGFAGPAVTASVAFSQPTWVDPFTFTMATPATVHVATPTTPATSAITLVDNGGFAGGINWSVSGLPYGMVASYTPGNPSATLTSLSLSMTNATSGQIGTYQVTLSGKYGSYTYSQTVTLTIAA